MDYIGSKAKLNNWIFNTLSKHIPKDEWNGLYFMDGCCGSGATSKFAIKQGFHVKSNDLFKFAGVIIKGFAGINANSNETEEIISEHIKNINSIESIEGFFFKNYSVDAGRSYFTDENAKKIDATRAYIDTVSDEKMKNYLLYMSLEGMSAVMNTTGVQAAFLKQIKERASKPFTVRFVPTYQSSVVTFTGDLLDVVEQDTDILYIDPPYNNRQYGPNYHLYETFVRNDNPKLAGVTGLRDWQKESKSRFCSKKTCRETFSSIVSASTAGIVMISYSSDGLLSEEELMSILTPYGKVTLYKKLQNRYKADKKDKRTYDTSDLYEFLFVIEKEKT